MSPVDPKAFWSIASTFPGNKEDIYPEHVEAQEFDLHKNKVVLEYGCGGGADAMSYLRRGCQVVYADIVPGNVLKTQQYIAASGYGPKAKPIVLKQSDAITLPAAFVDVVSAHGVIHHIVDPTMRERVLREFHRVLKPGGQLYVMFYTEMLRQRFAAKIAELVADHGITEGEAFGWCTDGRPCPYATSYDFKAGSELLIGAGFKVDSVFVYNGGDFRTFRATKA